MGPIAAIKHCLLNYRNFQGRAARSEFWWFAGFQQACAFIIAIISFVILGPGENLKIHPVTIFNLLAALPFAAVFARRLHDVNWSGWWQLVFWVVFPLGYFKVTKFMLSDAIPAWGNWVFFVAALIFNGLFLTVLAQWFRPSKNAATDIDVDEKIIAADKYTLEPFDWVPSPKNELYGCCP